MKKTITKPDGTQEVVEGTAEEIAAYERQVRQEPVREETKKPGILTDDLQRLGGVDWGKVLEEAMKQREKSYPTQYDRWFGCHNPTNPFCEISVANRGGWLCIIPPKCTCLGTSTFTVTTTSYYCGKCGKPTSGLNSSDLCNCANVNSEQIAQKREPDPHEFIDWDRYRWNSNITQDSFGKRF